MEYGPSNERLLKLALKKYYCDKAIKSIDSPYLLINEMYPVIEVECTTNLDKHDKVGLLEIIKSLQPQDDFSSDLRKFCRTVFYSNYS